VAEASAAKSQSSDVRAGQLPMSRAGKPEKSYKRECPEKTAPLRLNADFCLGIQPNRLKSGLPQGVRSLSPRAKRRSSSSLWFHFVVVTAPIVSETTSLTIVHSKSGNAWSYRRLVA
jgi:hypothetical protein